MKTKRRKLYEKARNIVRNNMTENRGVAVTAAQAPKVILAYNQFQKNKDARSGFVKASSTHKK